MKNFNLTKSITSSKGKKIISPAILIVAIFIAIYVAICFSIVLSSPNLQNFNTTKFNLTQNYMLAIFALFYFLLIASFLIIEKQGANKKIIAEFITLAISTALSTILYYTFAFTWLPLFVSALSLFFSLVLLHELKKTNKKAYFINLFVCLICVYLIINYYVICLIN